MSLFGLDALAALVTGAVFVSTGVLTIMALRWASDRRH